MSWMSWRVMGISSVLIHMFYVCSARMRTKGQHSVNHLPVDIKVWGCGTRRESGFGGNESFTVRKISYGEGEERVFPLYPHDRRNRSHTPR